MESLVACILILVEIGYWFKNWKGIRERPLRYAKKGLGVAKWSEFTDGLTNCTSVQSRAAKGAPLLHLTVHICSLVLHIRFRLAPFSLYNPWWNFVFPQTPNMHAMSLLRQRFILQYRVKLRGLSLPSMILPSTPRLWHTYIYIHISIVFIYYIYVLPLVFQTEFPSVYILPQFYVLVSLSVVLPA